MGKIFGISDLPVTIFTTPLQPIELPKPRVTDLKVLDIRKKFFTDIGKDIFLHNDPANVIKQTSRKVIK